MPSDVDSDPEVSSRQFQDREESMVEDSLPKKGPHTPANTPPPTPALLQQPSDSDNETSSLHIDETAPESPPSDSDNELSAFVGASGREAYKTGLKKLCHEKGLKYKDVRVCLDCCKLYPGENVHNCRHPEQHIQSDVDLDSYGDSASTGPFNEDDIGSCEYCNEEHYLSALHCSWFHLRKPCAKCSNIHEYSPVCDDTLPFLCEECYYCGETHKLEASVCEFYKSKKDCVKCLKRHEYRGRCYDEDSPELQRAEADDTDHCEEEVDTGHCDYCDSEHVLLAKHCHWFIQRKACAKCVNIHVYSPLCNDMLDILVDDCEYCDSRHKLEPTDCEVYIRRDECSKCWTVHEYRPRCEAQSPERIVDTVDCRFCGESHKVGWEYCPQIRAGGDCKNCGLDHAYDPICEADFMVSLAPNAQQSERLDTPVSNSTSCCDFCQSYHRPAAEFCLRFQQGELCATCGESHSWMLNCPNTGVDDGPSKPIDPEVSAVMHQAMLFQIDQQAAAGIQVNNLPENLFDDSPRASPRLNSPEVTDTATAILEAELCQSKRLYRAMQLERDDDISLSPTDEPLVADDSDDEPLAKKKKKHSKSASPKKKLKLVASPRRNSSSPTDPKKPDANISFEKLLLGKLPRKHLTPPRKRSSSPETVRKAPKRKGSPRKSPVKRRRGDSLKKWTATRSFEDLSSRCKRTPSIVIIDSSRRRTRSLSASALQQVRIDISRNDFAIAEAARASGGSSRYCTRPIIAGGYRTAANRRDIPATRQRRKDKAEGPPKCFNDKIDDTFDPSTIDFNFYKPVDRLRGIRTETYLSARELHDRSFWLTKREIARANELRREMEVELHAKASLIEHPPRYSKYWIKPEQRPYYRRPGESMDAVGPAGPKLPIPGTTLPKHLLLPEHCIGDAALCALRAGATYYDMRKKFGDKWAEIDNVIPKDWRDIPIGELEKIEKAKNSANQQYARKSKPARRSASAPRLMPAGIPEILTFTKPKHREHLNGVYIMHIKPVVTHLRAAANLGQIHNAYYKNTGFEKDPRYSDAGLLEESIPAADKIPADIFKVINGQCDDPEIHKKFWAWLDKNWRTAQIPYYRNIPRVFMDSEQNYMYYDETNDWTSIFQCLEEDSAGLKNAVSQVAPGPCCPFPWHREDLDTASFNQAVQEQQKFWYFTNRIDNKRKQQLEEWLYFYEHRDCCPAWGRHKLELYDPGWLIQDGIDVYYHRQHSNHFMITHEGSPHCGFSVTAGGATSYNAGFQPWFYYLAPDALREPQCACPSEAKNRELAKAYQKMREWAAIIDSIYCRQTFGEELHKFFLRQDGFRQPSWPIDMQLCCIECHLQFETPIKLSTHRSDYHKKKKEEKKKV